MRTLFVILVACLVSLLPVQAQLVLPGAVPAQGAATVAGKRAGTLPNRQKPAAMKIPGEDAIAGRELVLNGARGRIGFAKVGDALNVTLLQLAGSQISKPDDACQIDVVAGAPVTARPMGRPAGPLRFGVDLQACPFSFDVLDGAILVGPLPNVCVFEAADCKVDPAGLWGPRGASLGPERIKEIERARSGAEAAMREAFRNLLERAANQSAVKAASRDQAGFTSLRSEICRDYVREDVHGYCALMLTQARALALKADLGQPANAGPDDKPKKKRRRK